jgi:soluble lytic murein transglycosylase
MKPQSLQQGVILDRRATAGAVTPPAGRIVHESQPVVGAPTVVQQSQPSSHHLDEALEPTSKFLTSAIVGGAFAVSLLLAYPSVKAIITGPQDEDLASIISYQDLQERMLYSDEIGDKEPEELDPGEEPITSERDPTLSALVQAARVPEPQIRVTRVGQALQSQAGRPVIHRSTRTAASMAPAVKQQQHLYSPAVVRQVLRVIKRYGKKGIDQVELASAIVAEAKRQDYDPLFVAAVIKSESAFNTFATSHVGAKGLMQIMPKTGEYIEGFKDLEGIPRGGLTQPGYNLKLGITYLKYLEKMFNGNKVLTLIAYNWGPGHVAQTVRGEKSGVPRPVMNYALKILYDHNRWHEEIEQSAIS